MPRDDFSDNMNDDLGHKTRQGSDLGPILRDVPDGRRAMVALESYWQQIKGTDRLPRRRDLDASRMEEALPHAFILERIAPGVARLRIGGQVLCGHLGFDARGMPLSVLFSPEGRGQLRRWLDRCFDEPALVDVAVTARRGMLHAPVTGRLLLLPLLDQENRVTRAVGGLFLDRPARLAKVRFDLHEDATLRYERLMPSCPPLHAVAGDRAGHVPTDRRRPHLRLVVSNP